MVDSKPDYGEWLRDVRKEVEEGSEIVWAHSVWVHRLALEDEAQLAGFKKHIKTTVLEDAASVKCRIDDFIEKMLDPKDIGPDNFGGEFYPNMKNAMMYHLFGVRKKDG